MLYASSSYFYKESLLRFNDRKEVSKEMGEWIHDAMNGNKVLKRNAYGVRNLKRFRNRILHIFSDKNKENSPTLN